MSGVCCYTQCCSCLFWGDLGGISIEKQMNFQSVSYDNVGGAFVLFDTFLVNKHISGEGADFRPKA